MDPIPELEGEGPLSLCEELWYGLGLILDLNPVIQDEQLGEVS